MKLIYFILLLLSSKTFSHSEHSALLFNLCHEVGHHESQDFLSSDCGRWLFEKRHLLRSDLRAPVRKQFLPVTVDKKNSSPIEEIVRKVTEEYRDEIQKDYKVSLEILFDEENPEYFGGASLEGDKFQITFGKDIMNNKGMTEGAVLFLLCHEIGHLAGGKPKKETNKWASTEGQSDYFAAATCLKRLYEKRFKPRKYKISPVVKKFCGKDKACGLSLTAGKEFMDAVYDFINVPQLPKPDLDKEEPPLKEGVKLNYPSLQCRLDTIKNGAQNLERPSCWYIQKVSQD